MVETDKARSIFKGGSKTYYYSSVFFPRNVRKDVSILYSFVRKADDFVDHIPQKQGEFYAFEEGYKKALAGQESGDQVIDSFVDLMDRKGFDPGWVDAFLHSMGLDLVKSRYETLDELKVYLYGSAEVIGLMMAKIMGLPEASYESARYLGRSMQYINFIRDIEEDIELNRQYFPSEDLSRYDLDTLEYSETSRKVEDFTGFVDRQIDRYYDWQFKAEEGFRYIPRWYIIPIKTASDMYKWTAERISLDPYMVYERKLKPSKLRIMENGLLNVFHPKKRYEKVTH